jgi:hypothetical protein
VAALACALKPDPKIIISSFLSNRRTSERFEFARDGHWSSIGQGVAVEAVMMSRFNCQGSALLWPAASAASSGNSLRRKCDQLAGGFFAVVSGF